MLRAIAGISLAAIVCGAAFGQATGAVPGFEIADVHVSAKTAIPYRNDDAVRGGRYEIRAATILDLVHIAWDFDSGKIVGGPSWLGSDRFDVVAKVPENTAPETLHIMLQSLLAERFKLVVHKDSRPIPTWTLMVGRKPMLKPADGSGDGGCKMQPAPPGDQVRFTLFFSCHNITMADFAAALTGMRGVDVAREAVLDQTGLKGAWNFDVTWSPVGAPSLPGMEPSITASDALNKQLGLTLARQPVPAPVMVVDSVNEKPTDNPPGVAEALPTAPPPAFDVADVKPSAPDARGAPLEVQPGGRLVMHGETMSMLLGRALGVNAASYRVVGLPGWAATARFDIVAKAPTTTPLAIDTIGPMLRGLLVDRFKLATHTEERQVSTYSLVAAKPRLAKADPSNRSGCRRVPVPPGTPPARPWTITCQNTTMAQFADQLPALSTRYVSVPVVDTTGLEGVWDFTLSFSPLVVRTGGPIASDPDGTVTLFDALEKQLGLKLKEEKRSEPVIVIDHLEEKPTDN